jgi:hypothetical protein
VDREKLRRLRGWRAVPGWILIFAYPAYELVHALEAIDFVMELSRRPVVKWLTNPVNRTSEVIGCIIVGFVWLTILVSSDSKSERESASASEVERPSQDDKTLTEQDFRVLILLKSKVQSAYSIYDVTRALHIGWTEAEASLEKLTRTGNAQMDPFQKDALGDEFSAYSLTIKGGRRLLERGVA